MKYGNHGPQKDHRAIKWQDVSLLVQQLEREYGGHVSVLLDCEGTRGASGALWVRVLAYRGWDTQNERPIDSIARSWPTHSAATMAGLVFVMLHQLDHALDARHRSESEDVPF